MRIATWNLQRCPPHSSRAKVLVDWMSTQNADVWVLTETHIAFSLGSSFQSVGSGSPDRASAGGERWVMILARDASLEPVETSDAARTACARITFSNGRGLLVYGTVLPWLGSPWRGYPARNGKAFAAALDTQAADWSRLRSEYPDLPLCLAGDFNQDLNDRHYYGSRANRALLRETLDAHGLRCVTSGKGDPVFQLTAGSRGNIDHICLDTRLLAGKSISTWAWPESAEVRHGLSDHFGVAVELEPGRGGRK